MKKTTDFPGLFWFFLCVGITVIPGCVQRVPPPSNNVTNDNVSVISKIEFEKLYAPPEVIAAKREKARQGPVIYPGDELTLSIYDKLPASQEVRIEKKRVNNDGVIFLPPLQQVKVGGLTVAEITTEIETRLAEFVVSPFVEIEVAKRVYNPQIYVFGETGRNGLFPIREGYRLLDLVADAGGFTGNAFKKSVKIIRVSDKKIYMISIDARSIVENAQLSNNILLQDQDILYVPRTLITRMSEVMALIQNVLPWWYFVKNFGTLGF
jgi:protein involved in polysaccharide export with SLBB domain